ncbi:MAG: hypothetical protein ABL901_10190 [Hyphomicrobiaceae bacterium]
MRYIHRILFVITMLLLGNGNFHHAEARKAGGVYHPSSHIDLPTPIVRKPLPDHVPLPRNDAEGAFGPHEQVGSGGHYRYNETVLIPERFASLELQQALSQPIAPPILATFIGKEIPEYALLRDAAGVRHVDFPEDQEYVDQFFAERAGAVVVVAGHISKDGRLETSNGGELKSISTDLIEQTARRHSVILLVLGCHAGTFATSGPLGTLWTPDMIDRLKLAANSKTYSELLVGLGTPGVPLVLNSADVHGSELSYRLVSRLPEAHSEPVLEVRANMPGAPIAPTSPSTAPKITVAAPDQWSLAGAVVTFLYFVVTALSYCLVLSVLLYPFWLLFSGVRAVGHYVSNKPHPTSTPVTDLELDAAELEQLNVILNSKRQPWATRLATISLALQKAHISRQQFLSQSRAIIADYAHSEHQKQKPYPFAEPTVSLYDWKKDSPWPHHWKR